jgi:type I restriction enzyme S subunit
MAGRYKAYSEYKDSGVEWVGDVPSRWNVLPLFSAASPVCTKNSDGVEANVLSLSYGNVIRRDVDKNFGLLPESFNTYQIVESGDLILRLTDLQNDKRSLRVGHVQERGIITSAYLKLSAKSDKLDDRYLYRLLHSYDTTKVFYGMGGGLRQSMKFDDMRRLDLLIPPLPEQKQIARFLDHETGKIDALIEKQQALIALLQEKRQAVISHAVTKGLNPDARMKDSGVEWLGDVPEHWEVKRLRYLGQCQNGLNIGAEAFGSGYPFVSYGDVYKSRILPSTGSGLVQSSVSDRIAYSVLEGDVFFTRTSESIEEIGFSSTCLTVIQDATFAGFLIRFRPTEGELNQHFSKHYFGNSLLRAFFIKEMNLITRASLSQDLLKKLPVLLPPIDEQKEIGVYLDEKTELFSKLTDQAHEAIELMKERRTALISAAVTGKIDVRCWTAPEEPVQKEEV